MARPPRRPFDVLRWSFVLLAAIMLVQMSETLLAVGACTYMVLAGRSTIGACMEAGIVTQIRELFSEALTTVLALLLASRKPPE